MSQLAEQLLKSKNLPIMGALNQNCNLINQVPMPELLQNQSNMPKNIQNNGTKKFGQQKSQNGNSQESKLLIIY